MNLLFLTAFIPLAGYLFLSFSRGRLSESMAAIVGVGTVGISALIAAWITIGFLGTDGAAQTQLLWHWICLLYTSPSPRDRTRSRMPSSA